ncbi:hypothetical protein V491_07283 [Pseudogymnoascus sp. VKM F-3775]|nr:hypothetical protein V491_07283 [Pseudogymnoascus sp. VKM F-3775]
MPRTARNAAPVLCILLYCATSYTAASALPDPTSPTSPTPLIDSGGWRGYTACPVCTLKRLVALSLLVSSIPTAYPTPSSPPSNAPSRPSPPP